MLFLAKDGVRFDKLDTRLLTGLVRLGALMEHVLGITEATITSGTDGVHRTGSKHYIGRAVDIRTKFYDNAKLAEVVRLFDMPGYLLLWEANDTPNEHFHLEYKGLGGGS